ncbi:MAG: pyridoxamine 5'-phosphate oxidase family protein [Sphingomonadaceae bacterium]|nr:pyridoxamine 5'-phosphate oxidase family protein [Sphingobium sp.]MBP9157542.1 pyridoxamine 5'-phosphate oxidase family protein [Sphingobium sp.]MCC6482215.1 pyridoxamine 5'-phosphate oxidase family protein [Sphingomonadaceae bacterium]
MHNNDEIEKLTQDFWKALDASRTVMLSAVGVDAYPARPMTAQTDEDIKDGSIYFFASRGEGLGRDVLAGADKAHFAFQSKDHDILASAIGPIAAVNEPAMIDKLWSPMAATYYEGGRSDPDLLLLRFTPPEFEVWRSSTTGMLKAIAYKLAGKDAGQAHEEDRATISA